MRFVNNSSKTVYLTVNSYTADKVQETKSYGSSSGRVSIESGKELSVYSSAQAAYILFRAHKSNDSSSNTYTPFINGVYTEGATDVTSALNSPTVIASTVTVEFNDNSEETQSNRRWGLQLPTNIDLTGKKYQLNEKVGTQIGYYPASYYAVNATMQADDFTKSLPFQYGSYKYTYISVNTTFEFGTYEGGYYDRGETFVYCKYNPLNSEDADQWLIFNHLQAQAKSYRKCSPPTIEITGGEHVTAYGLWDWLETNGVLVGGEYDTPEVPEELPGGTTITYDGGTIAAVVSGGIATLKCAGLKMKTDITVKAAEGGEVLPRYDGDVEIEGEEIPDGGSGGSAEFNIAYGDTAPSDTSKLWVKANEPEAVKVTSNLVVGSEEIITGVAELYEGILQPATVAIGSKVYILGGRAGSYVRQWAYVYDTVTNVRTKLSDMPTTIYDMGFAAVGTKIYLFGGQTGTSSTYSMYIYEYDTESDTYTRVAFLDDDYASMTAAAVGTKIYLFGGGYSSVYYNTIYEFDTVTKVLTKLGAVLPAQASNVAATAVGTKIYLFGGRNSSYRNNTICVFDTDNLSIEKLSVTLPVAAGWIASAAIGKKIYLFGGQDKNYNLSTIAVFDTETNTYATLDAKLPTETSCISATAVGTKIYLFGGSGYIKPIHEFVTTFPLAANNLLIEASIKTNVVNILPNVELGVNNVYLGNAEGNGEKVEAYLHNGTEWVEV